jgi:hypothetical protein
MDDEDFEIDPELALIIDSPKDRLRRAYQESDERPFTVNEDFLEMLTFVGLSELVEEGLELRCEVAADMLEDATSQLYETVQFVEPTNRVFQMDIRSDYKAIKLMEEKGLKFEMNPPKYWNSIGYDNCINIAHNYVHLNEPLNIESTQIMLVAILHFLRIPFNLIEVEELENHRPIYIGPHRVLIDYNNTGGYIEERHGIIDSHHPQCIKNIGSCQDIIMDIKSCYDRCLGCQRNFRMMIESLYVRPAHMITTAMLVTNQDSTLDDDIIQFLIERVFRHSGCSINLLIMLHSLKVIDLTKYKGIIRRLDELLELYKPKLVKNSRRIE